MEETPEKYSFEWYLNRDSRFLEYLCTAVMHADNENLMKLRRIFPHLISANRDVQSWMKAPKNNLPPISNEDMMNSHIPSKSDDSNYKRGCFYWYLYRSGHFVSNLARAIVYSDSGNLGLLGKEYPQMVAAWVSDDRKKVPDGFLNPIYNSPAKSS